jgi:hypothetical protein
MLWLFLIAEKFVKKLAFLTQLKGNFCRKKWSQHRFLRKNAKCFDENTQKSQKIVIITSVPGLGDQLGVFFPFSYNQLGYNYLSSSAACCRRCVHNRYMYAWFSSQNSCKIIFCRQKRSFGDQLKVRVYYIFYLMHFSRIWVPLNPRNSKASSQRKTVSRV